MPSGPFTISVDYLHGTVDGCVRVVAIPHITAYRIPRDFADNLLDEPELKQAGIYLLVNEEDKTLYVGQADLRDNGKGVLARMVEPHRSKKEDVDNWTMGYALTCGTPHLFGATELNYLERFFYDKALENKRYQLLNGSRPHANDVSYSTKTVLRNYVNYAFFLLQYQLGCEVYVKEASSTKKRAKTDSVRKESSSSSSTELYIPGYGPIPADTPRFTMNSRGTELVGYLLDEDKGSFLVLAGGKVSDNCTDSFIKQSYYQKRLAYEEDGSIQDGVLMKPIVFPSVSAAASILGGASLNGQTVWKRVGE